MNFRVPPSCRQIPDEDADIVAVESFHYTMYGDEFVTEYDDDEDEAELDDSEKVGFACQNQSEFGICA